MLPGDRLLPGGRLQRGDSTHYSIQRWADSADHPAKKYQNGTDINVDIPSHCDKVRVHTQGATTTEELVGILESNDIGICAIKQVDENRFYMLVEGGYLIAQRLLTFDHPIIRSCDISSDGKQRRRLFNAKLEAAKVSC